MGILFRTLPEWEEEMTEEKKEKRFYSSWYKFTGIQPKTWTEEKLKLAVRGLYESKILNQQDGGDEAFLYMILYSNGLLNLSGEMRNYFKDLQKNARSQSGIGEIKKTAYAEEGFSETEIVVEESEDEEVAGTISVEQAAKEQERSLSLPYVKLEETKNILKRANIPDSLIDDFDKLDSYLNYLIKKLWNRTFVDEKTADEVRQEGETGNKFEDGVTSTFLNEYDDVKKLSIPEPWVTDLKPRLMQRYTAYKLKKEKGFGNISEPGSGKTLSALLASRLIDSKLTLILCPNHIVKQWIKNIHATFGDEFATTIPALVKHGEGFMLAGKKRDAFFAEYDKAKHQYLVINYDQLNLTKEKSRKLVLRLGGQKIDHIILDEFQSVKRRGTESKRRENVIRLLVKARKTNPEIRVLGLSATPVINELDEGISLLELLTGEDLTMKLSTRPTIPNAVTLYSYLMNNSIRQKKGYNIKIIEDDKTEVVAPMPPAAKLEKLNMSRLSIEHFLTDARIPEIVKRIKGQTIIYTDNVGTALNDEKTIVQKLINAVKSKGCSYGLYVGGDDTGFEQFKNGKCQVLIASLPISVGVDELQYNCHNLIFNTLPWTHAGYEQIVGRVVREGQKHSVNIHIIKAKIGPFTPDEDRIAALQFKRELADCAVDGVIPIGKSFETRERASRELVKMLTRISKGEISIIPKRALESDLTPLVQEVIAQPARRLAAISKFHKKMNLMSSTKLQEYFNKNPEKFKEYHQLYREDRKTLTVIPYEEIIERIRPLAKNLKIGDFGCGEGQIADAFRGRVKSFDLAIIGDPKKITQCNIRNVKEYVRNGSLNIVIFSLSLHCSDWRDYIKEAVRCLPKGGQVFIALTTKQFLGTRKDLPKVLEKHHFKIDEQYEKSTFTFIEARKI